MNARTNFSVDRLAPDLTVCRESYGCEVRSRSAQALIELPAQILSLLLRRFVV